MCEHSMGTVCVVCAEFGACAPQEFYEYMEKTRIEAVDELLKKYRTIPPLLGKVEEAVAGTNTGRSPQLVSYYQHWERAIFAALNRMVLSGMMEFNRLIAIAAKSDARVGGFYRCFAC